MKPTRATVVVNVASLAVLVWLYAGDLLDYRQAKLAPLSAMTSLPRAGYAAGALVLAAAAAGVAVHGLVRGAPEGFRGYRLLPIVLVVVLFVDLFILTSAQGPVMPPAEQVNAAMGALADAARARARHSSVLDPHLLEQLVPAMGAPPYLAHGQRVDHYVLSLRTDCAHAVDEASGAAAGTVFFCAAPGGRVGWLTVVGLPAGALFGEPQVFSVGGRVRAWEVQVPPADEGDAPPEPTLAEQDGGR